MITVFSTCRSFEIEEFATIQRNAITSWALLEPKPEIILMGHEPGVKEICEELNLVHIEHIEYSEQGTPMLDTMMQIAEEKASNDTLLLISSDVVIFQSMIKACCSLKNKFDQFCGVARKKQQEQIKPINFNQENWIEELEKDAKWNLITSGDFYLYPKNYWGKIPEFIIGRTFCDSWLFYESACKGNLVDMTNVVKIIDYKHSHPWPTGAHRERMQNFVLYNGKQADFRNANWRMNENFEILTANDLNQHPIPE